MDPKLIPLVVSRVESFVDNRGRVVIAKTELDPTNPFARNAPVFVGQGVAGVQVVTRNGVEIQQVHFEVPLPFETIHDAFAQFDAVQDGAFRAHMERMRIEALKQGADLTQLPKAHKKLDAR